jgi:hypothetical protein
METRIAVCYDECGDDATAYVSSIEQIPPEWQFRYWQEHSDRELAEWRLSLQDEDHWDQY